MLARARVGIDETGSGSSSTGAIWAVRQGQQNRRGRGRNNNRKNHNPLARSFESNGPDVKIRGTPAHIAEKYLTLSRDAQTSGDPVLAENYLQHAEHYMRIIMAYREQLQQPGEMANGNGQRLPGDGGDEFGDDDGEDILDEAFAPQHQHPSPPQHQPQRNSGGYDANRHERPFRRDQGSFRNRDRNDRDRGGGDRDRSDRDRGDRDRGDRDRPMEGRHPQQDRPPPQERHQEPVDAGPEPRRDEPRRDEPRRDEPRRDEPRRRDRFQQPHEQPEFLRRPVRRSRTESEEAAPSPVKDEPPRD